MNHAICPECPWIYTGIVPWLCHETKNAPIGAFNILIYCGFYKFSEQHYECAALPTELHRQQSVEL